ncbi:MAG: recombinase family protein [Clostridia bacterium]|nr:recombinase family protein [Clostridia bacterium]
MSGRKSKNFLSEKKLEKNQNWFVALYIRLSQEDDDTGKDKLESNSVTNQKALLNEFVKEQEDLKIYDTYVDDGFTGTDFNRPAFQKLLKDVENGNVNCVIVKDLSRLGRNYIEVRKLYREDFSII